MSNYLGNDERVKRINAAFPKYPVTVYDKNWIYGVWYCGTAWIKAEMYGQHPGTYLKRLLALFPDCKEWLHAPSGVLPHGEKDGRNHTTIDLISRKPGCPQYIGDCSALPFKDESFDIVETDPPYGAENCKIYKTPNYPRKRALNEFWRVLKPGGYCAWLDVRYPYYDKNRWEFIGLIGIVSGAERVTRICAIFKKRTDGGNNERVRSLRREIQETLQEKNVLPM